MDAAGKISVEIPTLCFLEGREPLTSCMVCAVKVEGRENLVPACATAAVEGMRVQSDCEEVRRARRTALELLLSDHVGDCLAPCQLLCPEGMNIPQMLRRIAAGDMAAAIETVMLEMALPAVLARVCTKPCEKGCRRAGLDGAISICSLKGAAADANLAAERPGLPARRPESGKKVAVVGAGPTGLSAAYHLARLGHAVTVFERNPRCGGRLLTEFDRKTLPAEVIDAEVGLIARLGVEFRTDTPVAHGESPTPGEMLDKFDAMLIAAGSQENEPPARVSSLWGMEASERGIRVDKDAYKTSRPSVFAAGDVVRSVKLIVRATAEGKLAARSIDRHLVGNPAEAIMPAFNIKIDRMTRDELASLAHDAESNRVKRELAGVNAATPAQAAARCLHCDCRGRDVCDLRRLAREYGADPGRFHRAGDERRLVRLYRHKDRLIFEPGKCIRCGRCIAIVGDAGVNLGLTFVGRGFDVEVAAALNRSLGDVFSGADGKTLDELAEKCIAACPTAALSRP